MQIANASIPSDGLIGHWDFEEGSGATAFDSSGNVLNGTIYDATYTTGKVGNYALDFNGTDSYVQVGYSPLLNPDSVGISLWFKPSASQQTYADILDKGHGEGTDPYYGGYVFQYEVDSPLIYAAYGNGASFPRTGLAEAYNDNQWHHIVANLGAAEIALYMDGQLISQALGDGSIIANPSDLFFGSHAVLGRFYQGSIDDISIYDRALSQAEVTQLYQSANPVPVPTAFWLFGSALAGLIGFARRKGY